MTNNSKTPRFDQALKEYWKGIELDEQGGLWRNCKVSGLAFYIRPGDVAFYKKIGVPLPVMNVEERWRLMLSFDNSYNLYHGKSALTGKPLITQYPPGFPSTIYEHTEWHSDRFNPFAYGRPYVSGEDFFTHYAKLQLETPRPNLIVDSSNINSDYTNETSYLKNCYLCFYCFGSENLQYVDGSYNTRDSMDGFSMVNCELCYMTHQANDCWKCSFAEYSRDCRECYFIFDCRNCSNCFMSSNLRNKDYYFRNEQLTKEEYHRRLEGVYLGNYDALHRYREEYKELKRRVIRRPARIDKCVNCWGEDLRNSKDCYRTMWADNSINVNYSLSCSDARDCSFIVGGGPGGSTSELNYCSAMLDGANQNVRFSLYAKDSRDLEYCDSCKNSVNCFGCYGLTNAKFCILNTQYDEEEYWQLIDVIKTDMLSAGTYGEFFPMSLSLYPYNLTLPVNYPGFTDLEEARRYGYRVEEVPEPQSDVGANVIKNHDLPLDIKDVGDNILRVVIEDTENKKFFRITAAELEFYRKFSWPLPRKHPLKRLEDWRTDEGNTSLRLEAHERTCPICAVKFQTPYLPNQFPDRVYCEKCYQENLT